MSSDIEIHEIFSVLELPSPVILFRTGIATFNSTMQGSGLILTTDSESNHRAFPPLPDGNDLAGML
jgi:hypothetical protein